MQWGGVPKNRELHTANLLSFNYLLCSTINRGHLDWLEHSSQPLDFNSWNRLPLDSSRTELPLDSSSTAYMFWGFYKFNFCATKMVTQNFRKRSRKKKFSAKFRIFVLRWTQVRRGRGMENYPFYCYVIKLTFACLNSKQEKEEKLKYFCHFK